MLPLTRLNRGCSSRRRCWCWRRRSRRPGPAAATSVSAACEVGDDRDVALRADRGSSALSSSRPARCWPPSTSGCDRRSTPSDANRYRELAEQHLGRGPVPSVSSGSGGSQLRSHPDVGAAEHALARRVPRRARRDGRTPVDHARGVGGRRRAVGLVGRHHELGAAELRRRRTTARSVNGTRRRSAADAGRRCRRPARRAASAVRLAHHDRRVADQRGATSAPITAADRVARATP